MITFETVVEIIIWTVVVFCGLVALTLMGAVVFMYFCFKQIKEYDEKEEEKCRERVEEMYARNSN